MRLETFPLIAGAILGLIALALLFDAWVPDNIIVPEERRRRQRLERDRLGEALVGLGVLAMAAAFVGRDTWRYSIVAVIAGSVLLLWGAKRNGGYLREAFVRGDKPKPKVAEGPRRVR
ncbi:MAG: hypothetical protein WD825_02385 [Gemmatimonadaceae bacterium]